MIFTRSSLEQVRSSVRSWFRSKDVTLPRSSSSWTILSDLRRTDRINRFSEWDRVKGPEEAQPGAAINPTETLFKDC